MEPLTSTLELLIVMLKESRIELQNIEDDRAALEAELHRIQSENQAIEFRRKEFALQKLLGKHERMNVHLRRKLIKCKRKTIS